jgi:hypothetical protein
VVDTSTPEIDQFGSVWLPLPHLMMVPFVRVDAWWRSGIAASFPAAAFFVMGGAFLFAAARRIFDSAAAGFTAAAIACLNPNLLYLQSTSMTEGYFFGALMAALYCTVRFREREGTGWAAGAGLAICGASLTRYEGWFLIPFAAAYFLFAGTRRRWPAAMLFSAIAAAGPLYWFGHNWWVTGDALAFYSGPYSPRAIQGGSPYPGSHDWRLAWMYYSAAAQLCVGPALPWMALAGAVVALARRVFWPLFLLALPPLFYIWSNHSSGGTPIYVPTLWPHTWYNTRYGLAALPLLALAASGLVTAVPRQLRGFIAVLAVCAGVIYWAAHPGPENWITWVESRANSEKRRAWTQEAAAFLAPRYVSGSGVFTTFGDMTGIFRQMGLPLRETLTETNLLTWDAAVRRPDLFLWEEWAIVANRSRGTDPVRSALERAGKCGIRYTLEKTITIGNEPAIEIYRRSGGNNGPS